MIINFYSLQNSFYKLLFMVLHIIIIFYLKDLICVISTWNVKVNIYHYGELFS